MKHTLTILTALLLVPLAALYGAADLVHPKSADVLYQSLPYFQWSDDKAAVLLEGKYQIEVSRDANFHDRVIEDEVPAIITHYSPHVALEVGGAFFWRVRYMSGEVEAGEWSKAERFLISPPAYVKEVSAKATWQEIQACVADVVKNSARGAKLMFPRGARYDLTCETDQTALFNLESASNIVIDCNSCEFVVDVPRNPGGDRLIARFVSAKEARHIEFKNAIFDLTPRSLMQFGGKIERIDAASHTIKVRVNPAIYPDYELKNRDKEVYFVDAAHQQKVGFTGVHYPMRKTWQESASGAETYTLEIEPAHWGRFSEELKVGDYAVSSNRGGDVFSAERSTDLVFFNNTTKASRGRYLASSLGSSFVRCISNHFLRTGGRIMGCSTGGVCSFSDHCWFEDTVFEYTRDDMLHSGEQESGDQLVVRNCKLTGAFRHSIWVHQSRLWIAHNTIEYASGSAISAGGVPIKRTNDGKHHGVSDSIFEFNTSRNSKDGAYLFNGKGNGDMDRLIVRSNESFNHQMNAAFKFTKVSKTTVNDNLIAGDTSQWRVYSSKENEAGFAVEGGNAIHGEGNRITDPRLAKLPAIIKSADSKNIAIHVDP